MDIFYKKISLIFDILVYLKDKIIYTFLVEMSLECLRIKYLKVKCLRSNKTYSVNKSKSKKYKILQFTSINGNEVYEFEICAKY